MNLYIWRHNKTYHSHSMINEPCVVNEFYLDALAIVEAETLDDALKLLEERNEGWRVEDLRELEPIVVPLEGAKVVYTHIFGQGPTGSAACLVIPNIFLERGDRLFMETQIERIRKMEKILDEATESLMALHREVERYQALQEKICQLETYYTEGQWRKDFEDDEAGRLPRDLKRGVLSEDGIYDFLDLRDKVKAKMAEAAQ